MSESSNIQTIAVIGGTGALGSGLARRWARAGYRVIIGSRSDEKALEAANEANAALGSDAVIEGMANAQAAAQSDIAVLTVPFAHQRVTLEGLREQLAGKILVDTTVPLVPPKVARVQLPDGGAAALLAQQAVGDQVQVVSAFQNVAADLVASDAQLDCDVLVTGDKPDARQVVVELAERAGMRAWHAGPLANAAAAEALTSILIFINRRNPGRHAGIRVTGIDDH
jgi:NADPH-dependent F420 reductase